MNTSEAGEGESLATEQSIENVAAHSYFRRGQAPQGRPVVRSPGELRLHPAMKELGWTGVIDELNDAARLKDHSVPEQVLITTNGTKPYSSYSPSIKPGADGMILSVFA
jgi:hypothetical protein